MLLFLDLLSTLCFACVGATIALRLQMNSVAVFLSAMLPATGGGTVRELLLGSETLFWIATPSYLLAVGLAIIIAVLMSRVKRVPAFVGRFFDSLGTCVFIMVGVLAAIDAGCSPFVVFLLGVLTGVGGGVIRELVFDRQAVLQNSMKIILATTMALLCTALMLLDSQMVNTVFLLTLLHFVQSEIHSRKVSSTKLSSTLLEKTSKKNDRFQLKHVDIVL